MRATLLVGVFLVVVTSCGSDSTQAFPSPTPSATSTPEVSVTPAGLLCRLPIDRGTGAFLDIPSSPIGAVVFTTTDDPTSQVNLPDGEARIALSYDWAFKRWLPVPYQWVAPDGTRYVYADSQGRLHLAGVADGSDTVVASGAIWGPYGFTNNGIFAGQRNPSKEPSLLGLWRIPPTGGAAQPLVADGTWLAIGADAAWSVIQDGPPPSSPAPENSVGSVVKRLDLNSGQVETWYTSSGGRVRVATVDAGGQPVLVNIDTADLLIMTSAGAAQTIKAGSLPFDLMADSNGVWFTQPMTSSIYLVRGNVPQRIGQYGYGGTMVFAGPCQ